MAYRRSSSFQMWLGCVPHKPQWSLIASKRYSFILLSFVCVCVFVNSHPNPLHKVRNKPLCVAPLWLTNQQWHGVLKQRHCCYPEVDYFPLKARPGVFYSSHITAECHQVQFLLVIAAVCVWSVCDLWSMCACRFIRVALAGLLWWGSVILNVLDYTIYTSKAE